MIPIAVEVVTKPHVLVFDHFDKMVGIADSHILLQSSSSIHLLDAGKQSLIASIFFSYDDDTLFPQVQRLVVKGKYIAFFVVAFSKGENDTQMQPPHLYVYEITSTGLKQIKADRLEEVYDNYSLSFVNEEQLSVLAIRNSETGDVAVQIESWIYHFHTNEVLRGPCFYPNDDYLDRRFNIETTYQFLSHHENLVALLVEKNYAFNGDIATENFLVVIDISERDELILEKLLYGECHNTFLEAAHLEDPELEEGVVFSSPFSASLFKGCIYYLVCSDVGGSAELRKINLETSEEEVVADFSHIETDCEFITIRFYPEGVLLVSDIRDLRVAIELESGQYTRIELENNDWMLDDSLAFFLFEEIFDLLEKSDGVIHSLRLDDTYKGFLLTDSSIITFSDSLLFALVNEARIIIFNHALARFTSGEMEDYPLAIIDVIDNTISKFEGEIPSDIERFQITEDVTAIHCGKKMIQFDRKHRFVLFDESL